MLFNGYSTANDARANAWGAVFGGLRFCLKILRDIALETWNRRIFRIELESKNFTLILGEGGDTEHYCDPMKYVIEVLDVAIRNGSLRQLNDSGYQPFLYIYFKNCRPGIIFMPHMPPKLRISVSQPILINIYFSIWCLDQQERENTNRFTIDVYIKGEKYLKIFSRASLIIQ